MHDHRRPSWIAALLLSCACAAPGHAGARITEAPPIVPDTLHEYRGLPSPHHAAQLSTVTTVAPITLGLLSAAAADAAPVFAGVAILAGVYGGIILGPTAGYAYGGVGGRGAEGALLRLAVVVVPPLLAYAMVGPGHRSGSFIPLQDRETAAVAAGVLGTLVAGTLAVYDVSVVAGHVDRRNRTQLESDTSLRLEPAATPFTHGPAVALTLHF